MVISPIMKYPLQLINKWIFIKFNSVYIFSSSMITRSEGKALKMIKDLLIILIAACFYLLWLLRFLEV